MLVHLTAANGAAWCSCHPPAGPNGKAIIPGFLSGVLPQTSRLWEIEKSYTRKITLLAMLVYFADAVIYIAQFRLMH